MINALSSQLLLASVTSGAIFFDPLAVKHSCVNDDGSTLTPGVPVHLADVETNGFEQTILLKPINGNTTINGLDDASTPMCVLHRWTKPMEAKAAGKGFYYPLGRSLPVVPAEVHGSIHPFHAGDWGSNYTGALGDWTRPPGKANRELDYVCGEAGNTGTNFAAGEYLCEVTLPTLSKPNLQDPTITDYNNAPYFLTYYERSMTVRNELSRFLQKNTFGPTKEELDALEATFEALLANGVEVEEPTSPPSSDDLSPEEPPVTNGTTSPATNGTRRLATAPLTHSAAMAQLQLNWVQDQMDASTFSTGEFTSLRAYWRRRLNPRKEETYRIGESGPHPCERNSRWRKFAFTNFDVQNSKSLRWGNQDIGGSYQTQRGHRISVETVEYWAPVDDDVAIDYNSTNSTNITTSINSTNAPTLSPIVATPVPSSSPVELPTTYSPTATPTLSWLPSFTPAPTSENLLVMADMEGDPRSTLNHWIGRCTRTVMNAADTPDDVYEGEHSLKYGGKRGCFLFRPIGHSCPKRIKQKLLEGDVVHIEMKVKVAQPNQMFHVYTAHYDPKKGARKWKMPKDDSYIIQRTKILEANVWTTIEATYRVGDDWKFRNDLTDKTEIMVPERCQHYHLRFRLNSASTWIIDDVKLTKLFDANATSFALADDEGSDANATAPEDRSIASADQFDAPHSGFFTNQNFALEHQYWKYAPTAGYLRRDADVGRDVMVMRNGRVLRQNVLNRAIPAKKYQFAFKAKMANVDAAELRIIVRMKFLNNDLKNGVCTRKICNFFKRPLTRVVRNTGGWQEIVTEEFEMFGNWTEWDGRVDFILFQLSTKDMGTTGELMVTDFEDLGDTYTDAPSTSLSPSAGPTTLVVQHINYVIRYAGEVRTVIDYPFQIDKTGERLDMSGAREYQLCEVDEVEGLKAPAFPDRMNLFVGGRCQPIRNGNPTVNLDPKFINMTELHMLDLTNPNTTSIIPINVEQTFGGDWLLETAVQDEMCPTFPTPYDNDYRGADPENENDIPTRFVPDKPVFAQLPDGSYAIFDSRLILHGNTVENPVMDGGGKSVLRSTLRAQRDGLKTLKYAWLEEYYIYNDHNIALCTNEQPNFLNQDNCVLSYEENVCVKEYIDSSNTLVDVHMVVTFDEETLAKFHEATRAAYIARNFTGRDNSRYLYAVDNLRWDDSVIHANITVLPCVPENPVSRWRPRPDLNVSECANTMTERSNHAFAHALETSNDENPYLRDIYLWNDHEDDGCDEVDYDQYGMLVMTKEGCWENMYPDFMSIYDFTNYEAEHSSFETVNETQIYIHNWTTTGILRYPDSHDMRHFEELKESFGIIMAVERYSYASTSRVNQGARFGDVIILDQMADQMQLNKDATILGTLAKDVAQMTLANKVVSNRGGGTLVCGSPNEVAPDPTLDDYFDVIHRDLDCIGCQDSYGDYAKQKATVWAMNVIEGEDQLCQRMAWSLYELLNVGAASNPDNTESNLYTYDIFIRHCFGSYFDILKELTHSPKMGEQFNFIGSTATRLSWDTQGLLLFPDENYGREIMQLYTTGLHELNPDGTEVRDDFGQVEQVYTNVDIMNSARVLTGFDFTARRGNVEELFRSEKSRQDPLRMSVDKHDFFPKGSVGGNWIGDRYPLCADLPHRHFLKKGATYRLRGSSSLPRQHYNPSHWDSDESIKRFVLGHESGLYKELCNPYESGDCNYANTVVLDTNIACHDKECRIDDIEVVQVNAGTFYEYVRQPCVNLIVYPSPKKVITGFSTWVQKVGRRHTHAMCADSRLALAARSCCNFGSAHRSEYNYDFEYHGERVELSTNLDQCALVNGTVCDPVAMKADNPLVNIRPVYDYPYPSQNTFFWTDADCTLSMKVRADGMIAIIHDPAGNPWFELDENTVPYVDLINSVNFFSVTWEKHPMTFVDQYPNIDNMCGNGVCSITTDDACLCSLTLNEAPVFTSLPSRAEVLSLKIGAVDPDAFSDSNVNYTLWEFSDDVEAYVSSDSAIGIGSTSTIFKVADEYGDVVFLKNMRSLITLGETYEIRNPPSFMNLVKVELRDAEYEIDAFLTHLIRYPSSAPFICKKLIQYHGISNPSPGFVQRVTQAFISGHFTRGGVSFGNRKYGNLKAVAAAITLDPESLSPVVDEDPISGNIREPLLKLIQLMRSLDFKRRPHVKFRHGLFENMAYKMGQMVFDPPDQFSFFASDYAPPGLFSTADLVSPESELLSMSSVVGFMNGVNSFVNYGLAYADGGFAASLARMAQVGDYSTSMGTLTYPYNTNGTSVSLKVDELDTMLTAGRLSAENKQVIVDAHAYFAQEYSVDHADRVLLKLLAATAEFHTSNTVRKTGNPRPITPPAPKSSSPYKAIVYINLAGGADSFNILTPGKSGCSLYNGYWEARGRGAGIGLRTDQILDIDASSAGISGCSKLGVNMLLSAYRDIFNEGKGVFFANMGHLHKPVNKQNWLTETKTDLFSHHTMKFESHAVDAFREGEGPGVLGRMLDILQRHGHAVGATAVNARAPMIDGSPDTGRLADIMSTEGVPRVFDRNFLKGEDQQLREHLELLHAETGDNSGVFGDKYSQTFVDIWNKTDALVETLRGSKLKTSFPNGPNIGGIASQLKMIAKLINIRNRRGDGINRDVFYCEMGGYDSHFQVGTVMENKLPSLNHAVATFWAEIKAQGLASQVTVVQGSEFGRTITANSNKGSDHAWGGNYFMFGGDVKGGKIWGEYPKSFAESDPTNIGRGRILPTTSWDALFHALTQWMGITDPNEIEYVLPNSGNFGCNLYTDYDLFTTGQQSLNGCGGNTFTTPITFQVPDIRMLTGSEQKQVCRLATRTTAITLSRSLGYEVDRSKARCYVTDQVIVDSEIAPGMYDVNGIGVLNFDSTTPKAATHPARAKAISKAASATASDFVIAGALPQSDAPSQTPSMQPSTSAEPSSTPSMSAMPSTLPSQSPSMVPSFSSNPTISPSISLEPSRLPTDAPSFTQLPSMSPSISHAPSISFYPTISPTARKVFEDEFQSRDISNVGFAGQSYESEESGLYILQGSGHDIYGTYDGFHYMYLETSGDATFTALVEGFDANDYWAKVGIMVRGSYSQYSSHYSIFQTYGYGVANLYRTCQSCSSVHYGHSWNRYSKVWLRIVKQGNVMTAFYKPSYLLASDPWIQYGHKLSMTSISSNGYLIGIAVTGHGNNLSDVATARVSNIQLTRTCTSESITRLQCDQASNCETGGVSGLCYHKGEVPLWETAEAVSTIFDVGSTVTTFGCNANSVSGNRAFDTSTSKFYCGLTNGEPSGLIIKPFHNRISIAERLRIFAGNNCPNCDPVAFILEGRSDESEAWVQISAGDLPWKTSIPPRNSILGLDISSTYTSGDSSLSFAEVSFYSRDTCGSKPLQKDYRGTNATTVTDIDCQSWGTQFPHAHDKTAENFPEAGLGDHNYCRNPDGEPGGAWCYTINPDVRWQYCGMPDCVDDPSTLEDYKEYKITFTETRDPGSSVLSLSEIQVPGLLGEMQGLPTLEYAGSYMSNVMHGETDVYLMDGYTSGNIHKNAFNGNTYKFHMYHDSTPLLSGHAPGFKVAPTDGHPYQLSVVQGMRVYTGNNNPGGDPIKYRIEGRSRPGANLSTRYNDYCLRALLESGGYHLKVDTQCQGTSPMLFYMTDLGEIRNLQYPSLCVDARQSTNGVRLITCYSDQYGPDQWAVRYYQKWHFDPETEELKNDVHAQCLDFNYNTGYVYMHPCHGGSNQKFYSTELTTGGRFSNSVDLDNWELISEGNLPWISEFDRNPTGLNIISSSTSGDANRNFMEVKFFTSTTPFWEYKITFPETRAFPSDITQFASIELPGMVLDPEEIVFTPNDYNQWFPFSISSIGDTGQLAFSVKASNDAHVALGSAEDIPTGRNVPNHLEVFIGAWDNSRSGIRLATGDIPVETGGSHLSGSEYRTFRITWTPSEITLERLGGGEWSTMVTMDRSSLGITIDRALVMTGWGSTGEWKDSEGLPAWTLALNINPSDSNDAGYGSDIWSGTSNYGSEAESLSKDYKDFSAWQQPFDCLAITRHTDAGTVDGVKVWKMDELLKFEDYFKSTAVRRQVVTSNGPVQRTIKNGAANINTDPILASNGANNNLAFNWVYSNNGARVILTDVGHHSGTLSGADDNDDDSHGIGNDLSGLNSSYKHDASIIQANCHGAGCKVQGSDAGTSFTGANRLTKYGNYGFFLTSAMSNGSCPTFKMNTL